MSVIGADDYLNFQRNLIAESANRMQRLSQREQLEQQRAQAQQAAAQAQGQQAETARYHDALIQKWGSDFALAVKRMQFDQDVQKAKDEYDKRYLALQERQFKAQEELNATLDAKRKIEIEQARLEMDTVRRERDELRQAETDLIGIAKAYEGLQAAKQPTAEGEGPDEQKITQARLDLLNTLIKSAPAARAQFQAARGIATEAQFAEELLGVKIFGEEAQARKQMAEARRLETPSLEPQTGAEAVARNNWVKGYKERMIERHGAMKVAGLPAFDSVEDVRTQRTQFFNTQWRTNDAVVAALDVLRKTGAFSGMDMGKLAVESILQSGGQATLAGLTQVAHDYQVKRKEAMGEALGAIETLKKQRDALIIKSRKYDLAESLMAGREMAINRTVEDIYGAVRDHPQWESEASARINRALEGEGTVWRELFADADVVGLIERFRNSASPTTETWTNVAAAIVNRLRQLGITDQDQVKHIIDQIHLTHPAFAITPEE